MAGYLMDGAGRCIQRISSGHVAVLEQAVGRKIVGNRRASGSHAAPSVRPNICLGRVIVWTDDGRTCHVAGAR